MNILLHTPSRLLRVLPVIVLACAACPQFARAQVSAGSLALRWDHCYGDGGTDAQSFACDTNSGSSVLVVSACPPVAMPQLNGAGVDLRIIMAASAPLPSWWHLESGGCRGTAALSASFVPPAGSVQCLDPWAGQAFGGVDFTPNFVSPTQARLRAVCGIDQSIAIPAGGEIFLARLVVLHSKTLGAGSCNGCLGGACIGLSSVRLTQPLGVGDYVILNALPGTNSDVVGWQLNGVQMPYVIEGPPGALDKTFLSCTAATAASKTTWGTIKQLYR